MPTAIITISEVVFTASPEIFLRKIFNKIFIELPMENKAKYMDNYLLNKKFTVLKTGLKVLYHVALICTIYCITDMICTVACPEIEVMRFFSFSIMSTRPQKAFYQKLITRSFPKQKTNFSLPRQLFSSLITTRIVLTLTL